MSGAMMSSLGQLRRDLETQLRFEMLLAEVSTKFIDVPVDQMDNLIEISQCRICECLGFDRSTLWQISGQKRDEFLLTHLHQPPHIPPP